MARASDIVEGIMNPDPSFYVGRGNMLGDLDSHKIEDIYYRVVANGGPEAGTAFVRMVADLTMRGDMSATTFLSALSDFAYNNWQYDGSTPTTEAAALSSIELGGYGDEAKDALKLVGSLGPSSSAVSADRISGEFLHRHPLPASMRSPKVGAEYSGVPVVGPVTAALDRIRRVRKPADDDSDNPSNLRSV